MGHLTDQATINYMLSITTVASFLRNSVLSLILYFSKQLLAKILAFFYMVIRLATILVTAKKYHIHVIAITSWRVRKRAHVQTAGGVTRCRVAEVSFD